MYKEYLNKKKKTPAKYKYKKIIIIWFLKKKKYVFSAL